MNGAALFTELSPGNVFATSVSSSVDDIDVNFLSKQQTIVTYSLTFFAVFAFLC